jgi:hypothetical protein
MRISGATLLPPISFHGVVLKCGTALYLSPIIVNRVINALGQGLYTRQEEIQTLWMGRNLLFAKHPDI